MENVEIEHHRFCNKPYSVFKREGKVITPIGYFDTETEAKKAKMQYELMQESRQKHK